MNLNWLDPEQLETGDVAGAVAVFEAARAAEYPHEPEPTTSSFIAHLRHGWDGDPTFAALARNARGRVTGILEVSLPKWDNTHLGFVEVTVDPADRRQGLGRALFEAGTDRTRADGRTMILAGAFDQTAGEPFLKAMGLERGSTGIKREQDLLTVDWPALDALYADAEERAADYELLKLPGDVPDEMLDEIVQLTEAINDAPIDDLDIEDEVFSPERIRAFEAAQAAQRRRQYRLIARRRDTGEPAGHTMVGVDDERPWHGWQNDTSVVESHRGHRLGLLLKIAMLRWLAEVEPQLRRLQTWNTATNAHMIRVNELLGYRIVASGGEWQRHL